MDYNWSSVVWHNDKLPQGLTARFCLWITSFCRLLESINRLIGHWVAWLALFMGLVTFIIVVMRYGFNSGSIKLQESVVYMHALLFMLCGAYCLQQDKHVRIDIFYSHLSLRGRAWIDLVGTVFFLLPGCIFLFIISLEYVFASWSYLESSQEPSGLPYVYLLKSVLLIMPLMITLQGVSELWRNYCFLCGWISYQEEEREKGESLAT